ncbi:MAG: SurA N-terminal domain-containing protein [Treponema sp.]|nr:SurA N-terminal domain-containing protein [Treponema sp.]
MAKRDKKGPTQERESAGAEIIKKFKQSPGIYIGSVVILVLVTVTFIGGDFLSGGGLGSSGGDLTFGYYDKVPISWVPGNMLSQYYEQAVFNFRSQGYDPNDSWVSYYIWKQAYERTVVHTAVLQMTNKSNYKASGKTVDKEIVQLPQFYDNGRFSMTLYNRMSDSARLSLWRQTQEDLTKRMFFRDFFRLLVPENEANFIAAMGSPNRSFEAVRFFVDDYPESEYLSYAYDNSALFGTIHLSKISVSSEREAKRILDSVRNGTITFEDAARTQSIDGFSDRGGDMGIRFCYELNDEIPGFFDRDTIYNLGRGEISDIVSTTDGWSFFRVESELIDANFNDSGMMDRVRFHLRSFSRGRMEDWAIEQAYNFINDSMESGFGNAVRSRNLERYSFGPLPLNYGGVDLFTSLESFENSGISSQELQELSSNENFWRVAFSAPVNSPSEPLVQGNYVFVFFPVQESETNESLIENVAAGYASYVETITDRSLQFYFLSNDEKMEDNFSDVFFRYFM